MVTKIQKWGNSLGVRLPRPAAKDARVDVGTLVDVQVKKGEIVLHPIREKRYDLDEMLAGVHPSNLHGEIETGRPVGREVL
ncbi:MAG: AbrB/MazE/SpoVT family DNA-binding domain-containing protein [Elusimicrobia bacterium]|nr:AbrB/MazE/SpoVT family DNA-binding domain-containing protein [Elusimicrobiota bacterium]